MCPGGGEEQAAAATVFALLCIQLGGGDETEEGFKMLRPILTTILNDNTASIAARQSVSERTTPLSLKSCETLDLGLLIIFLIKKKSKMK